MERMLRRNFLSILACEVCWGLGMPLALESTVLPMLVLALGGDAFHVGILSALGSAGYAAGLAIVLVFKQEPALWGAMFLDGMGTASRFLSDYALPLTLVGEHRTLPFYSVGTVVYATPLLVLSPVAGYAVGRFGFAPVALAALLGATLSLAWFVAMLGRVPRTNAQDLS